MSPPPPSVFPFMFSVHASSSFFSPHGLYISLASLIFSHLLVCSCSYSSFLIFSVLSIPIIHLNIRIPVLSIASFAQPFVSALTTIHRTCSRYDDILYIAALSVMSILLSHTIPDNHVSPLSPCSSHALDVSQYHHFCFLRIYLYFDTLLLQSCLSFHHSSLSIRFSLCQNPQVIYTQ